MNIKSLLSAAFVSAAALAFTGCGSDDASFIVVKDTKVQFTEFGMISAKISGIATTPETSTEALGKSYRENLTKDSKKIYLNDIKGVYKQPYYMVQIKTELRFDKEDIDMINTPTYTKYPLVQFNKKFLDTLKTYKPTDAFITWLATKSSATMDPATVDEIASVNEKMNCFDRTIIPSLLTAAKVNPSCKGEYCALKWKSDIMSEVDIKNRFTKHVLSMMPENESYSSNYRMESAINNLISQEKSACDFTWLVIDLSMSKHAAAFVKMGYNKRAAEKPMTEAQNDSIVSAINETYEIFDDIPTL